MASPTFNTSYAKRYLVNITANDALDTNYTHNISFSFNGNSSELGSAQHFAFGGGSTVLACEKIHVIFNGTIELPREIAQCNTSNFQIFFRNPVNITRNGTLLNSIEIYYDPSGANYQAPEDWTAIWIGTSDNFDGGINSTRWLFDNTTGNGNSTWINQSGNGVMRIGSGADPNDGCFRSADSATAGNNITQTNAGIEFLFNKRTSWQVLTGNSAMGLDDRPCGVSPNTDGFGAIIKDDLAGDRKGIALRSLDESGFVSTAAKELNRPPQGTWTVLATNWTGQTRTGGFSGTATNNASSHDQQTSFVPDATRATRVLMRYEGGNEDVIDIDEIRVSQLINSSPTYTIYQENRTTSENTLTIPVQACTSADRNANSNQYDEACDATYPANCGTNLTNDLLTCNDNGFETQLFKKDKFTGLHIQAFNSTINNCNTITGVKFCYRWWTNGDNLKNCTVAVDANGNASYTIINSTCPNVVNATCSLESPTPTVVCTDVTSSESWSCNNFFGTVGTKAVAKHELSTNDLGQSRVLMTDALYFNVTYN